MISEHRDTEEKYDTNKSGDLKESKDVTKDDVIVSLIKRGKTLRNSIMESRANVEANAETSCVVDHDEEEHLEERSASGSLFREILGLEEAEDTELKTEISLPVDLVVAGSSDDDTRSSIGSESDDPMHDETLLQDLFYVNKDDSAVIPTLNEPATFDDVEDDAKERNTKHVFDKEQGEKDPLSERKPIFDLKAASVREEKESLPETIADNNNWDHVFSTEKKPRSPDNTQNKDILSCLGVNKLTALGRVTAAKIHINKLNLLNESNTSDKRTYFIEYEFPVAADHGQVGQKNDVGLEITRIATNKTTTHSIVFNHHSVFPIHFNLPVIRFWCECELKINIFKRKSGQKSPVIIGRGKIALRNVFASDHLHYEGLVQIKVYSKQDGLSSQSSPTSSSKEGPLLGELEIKINLMSNGKDLDYFSPAKNHENVSSEIRSDVGNRKEHFSSGVKGTERVSTEQIPRQAHVNEKERGQLGKEGFVFTPASSSNKTAQYHSVPLTTLLWVSEGRNILRDGHGVAVSVPETMTRSNYYLISRMFWTSDITRSSVSWGQNHPKFNFRQIFPVLLTSALLDRMHNNFLTLEVWSKSGGTQEDELVGIAKIPLQQLYLSYKEKQTAKALLKSKFPVVGVDCWLNIGNPFQGSSHGEVHVLLAMGSENQINKLLDIKQCSNQHDYFKPKDRLGGDFNISPKYSGETNVEHWFEISVQNVKKLSAFETTSLGETDCFVQYNFPYQKPDFDAVTSAGLCEDLPGLQSHRTATTACVPNTNFNDVARYRIVLPPSLPVQRYLLAAYHGSWSGSGMSAVVTFELWKRYYYPNIRDQLVAKSSLPLSKLCGMVTMHKPGETNTQSFSLPLTTLSNSAEDWKSEPGGVLDVIIKYRQSKVANPNIHQFKENSAGANTQVCLAIEIVRACGLKCALTEQAKKDSSLTYASEVGGNPFVKIKLPFNIKMNERTTRTIAKTFTPEFGYRMEFILPLVLKHNLVGRDSQEFSGTLAECLEFGEAVFEIWHQRPREDYENWGEEIPMGQSFSRRQLPPTSDVLLGVVKIPLQQLLFSHTGVRGWFPLSLSTMGWSNEDDARNGLNKTVGGLELIINFSENTTREEIIESGRAVGWCPPLWYELEDGQWLNDTDDNGIMNVGQGLAFLVNIKKVWVPRAVVTAEQARKGVKGIKQIGCYIRYKFYDSKAVFSPICGVKKVKESDSILCDLKHRHSYIVKTTSPFIWYIREERLEIQVWLTTRQHDEKTTLPHKRDKLVGSAFVALFPLLDGNKNSSQISGLYPLFRSSAIDLRGAGLHVQLVLQKPINSQQTLGGEIDEDIASTEPSESVLLEKESFTLVSSDEADEQKEAGKHMCMGKTEEISSTEDDNNVITAHVVIERALHIPLLRTDENKSVQPNVYVTYQPRPEVKVIKTKTIRLSSSPVWDHEKIVKFDKSKIGKKVLTFKVWHNQGDTGQSTADEDLLLGLASVDLSPLASGLRQVMGWYNIVDFSGQCQGQVKVGVVPLLSVSPERLLLRPVNAHLSTASTSDVFAKRANGLSSRQPSGTTADTGNYSVSSPPLNEAADSTKSFLLRQLRQNLNDLEVIKDKLSQRLVADNGALSSCVKNKSSGSMNNTDMVDKCDELVKTYPVGDGLTLLTTASNHEKPLMTRVSVVQDHTTMKPSRLLEGEDHQVPPIYQIDASRTGSPVPQTISQRCDSNNDSENDYKEFDCSRSRDTNDYCGNIKELNSETNYYTNDKDVEEENKVGLSYRDNDYDDGIQGDNYEEDIDDCNDSNHIDNRKHGGGDDDNEDDHYDDHDDDIHGGNDDNGGNYGGDDDNDNDGNYVGDDDNDDDGGGDDYISETVPDPKQYINDIINDRINGYGQNEDASAVVDTGPTNVVTKPPEKTSRFNVVQENIEQLDNSNIGDSGDESLDSFFDCIPLKQKFEPRHPVNATNETFDLSVEPEFVVSRANLSKLRNVLNEKTKEETHTNKLEQQTKSNQQLLGSDKLSTLETNENKKDSRRPSELILDEFKITEQDQNHVDRESFHEQSKHETSRMNALIPNFFMSSKDLEQSMRSLRLAATFSRKELRHDESNGFREQKQDTENSEDQETSQKKILTKSFINWKKIQEIRDTGEIPLSSLETSRLSRIFSSNYVTKK
ncbi:C2 domain-containing protein 3-like isoform X2 [Dendronephthya gigantea]|nr:C2 domain-containing protein 3-like isoform X2 [Dendronephthya gigantea]